MWACKTKIGLFKIIALSNGRYDLWINDVNLGNYSSPDAAADDVYNCATGWDDWDLQLMVDHPSDLSEWQRIKN